VAGKAGNGTALLLASGATEEAEEAEVEAELLAM